jgi:hypothetical protein
VQRLSDPYYCRIIPAILMSIVPVLHSLKHLRVADSFYAYANGERISVARLANHIEDGIYHSIAVGSVRPSAGSANPVKVVERIHTDRSVSGTDSGDREDPERKCCSVELHFGCD